jgi:DNA-binding NtrC family response regulator
MTGPRKILIADDEEGIRDLLSDALSGRGFKITLARDGRETLDYMKRGKFDLLITDLDMPRLDGIGLLKKMKKAGRKEKIIIMTGSSVDHSRYAKDIPPVFARLDKPFHLVKFLKVVASALAKSTHKRKLACLN